MAAFVAGAVVADVRWPNRFAPDFAPLPLRCAGPGVWKKCSPEAEAAGKLLR
jgi:hypothetical protein